MTGNGLNQALAYADDINLLGAGHQKVQIFLYRSVKKLSWVNV